MTHSDTGAPDEPEAAGLSRWFAPGVVAAVLLVATFTTVPARLPVSVCGFYNLTGLPCPGCGMTRGFVAMGHAQFGRAWRVNPLAPPFFLLLLCYLVWFAARRTRPAVRLRLWLSRHRRSLYAMILCIVAASWALNVTRHLRGDRPTAPPLIASACRRMITGRSRTEQGSGNDGPRQPVSYSASRSTPKASSAR
jgi:hypothetical protein